ncbi:MAG TPA: hypothetical protein VGQ96_01655 [Candidatus Eremiobacteraceae bacterium]|nr:hypothetical protein [Candidatus Eremiobacteraceae bacterium]
MVGSDTDVAVSVIVSSLGGTLLGALYVSAAPLALDVFVIVPQGPTVHATAHLTPLLFGSLLTVAVSDADWFVSMFKLLGLYVSVTAIAEDGVDVGVDVGGGEGGGGGVGEWNGIALPPPPQPAASSESPSRKQKLVVSKFFIDFLLRASQLRRCPTSEALRT